MTPGMDFWIWDFFLKLGGFAFFGGGGSSKRIVAQKCSFVAKTYFTFSPQVEMAFSKFDSSGDDKLDYRSQNILIHLLLMIIFKLMR